MALPDPDAIIKLARQRSTGLTSMYDEITKLPGIEPARPVYLRPSMFPVCSLTLMDMILYPEHQEWNYASDYFTGVGTAVHTIIERWAGRTNARMWGNWHCHRGHKWYHTDRKFCPECNGKGHYDEITIEYLGVKGHIDGIIITDEGVLIGDYKTTTKYGVGKPTFREHNMQYPLQIFTYAYMMERVWGKHFWKHYRKRVCGASLLFVSRDNPFNTREFTWDRDTALRYGRETIRNAVIAWRAAQRSIASGDVTSAMRHKNCSRPSVYDNKVSQYFCYEPCWLSEMCWKAKNVQKHFDEGLDRHARLKRRENQLVLKGSKNG